MEGAEASPDRARKSYGSRSKKRQSGGAEDSRHESDAESTTEQPIPRSPIPIRPHAKLVEKNYAETNTPAKSTSKANSRNSAKNVASHSRGSSIASTVTSSPQSVRKPASASNMKPPSTVGGTKPPSSAGMRATPDGSTDGDNSKTWTRKTEAERIQVFNEDPLCAEVEPFRAKCKQCDTWIVLHDSRKYVMKHWKEHRKTCYVRAESTSTVPASPSVGPGDGPVLILADPQMMSSPSKDTPKPRTRRTEAERRAYLENHPYSGEVRPSEVFCVQCHRWIKLALKQNYVTSNWDVHNKQVHPVTADTPQKEVPSSTDKQESGSPVVASAPAGQSSVVPSSSDSIISDQAVDTTNSTPRKRAREDDEDAPEPETRVVRARTESYRPVTGLWRRLTEPIIHFWSGFKQGLASGSDIPPASQDSTTAREGTTPDTSIPSTSNNDTAPVITSSSIDISNPVIPSPSNTT